MLDMLLLLSTALTGRVWASRAARALGVSVNTAWRRARRLASRGLLEPRGARGRFELTRDGVRVLVARVIEHCSMLDDVVRLVAQVRGDGWAATGVYALYHHDMLYHMPPRPPQYW